jgi:D-alanyl-D-alanine carboxypeptidase (penicillin-binding protein 5/6)
MQDVPQEPLLKQQMRRRRQRRIVGTVSLLVLIVVAYVAVIGNAPLPDLSPQQAESAKTTVAAHDSALKKAVHAQKNPVGIAWVANGTVTEHGQWVNSKKTVPIASITKVVTALVGLEKMPIKEGSDGKTYTVKDRDEKIIDRVTQQNGIWESVHTGQKLTQRQLLELMMLPSANNYAITYADWIFGDNTSFVQATKKWLKKHDLDATTIAEPSGLNEHNRSSVADLIKISALALDDPVLASVMKEKSAKIPQIGKIETTNAFVESGSAVGVKTGTLAEAGYNIAVASEHRAGSRKLTLVAVELGADSPQDRIDLSARLVKAAKKSVTAHEVVPAQQQVGEVTTWDGQRVALRADNAKTIRSVLVPGEQARAETELRGVNVSERDDVAGTIHVETPVGKQKVSVVPERPIEDPGFSWRLGHPFIVLGFAAPQQPASSPTE